VGDYRAAVSYDDGAKANMIDQTLPTPEQLELQRSRLVRLCATITGDPDAAEDLAQEALIAAWRHLQTLRSPESLNGWLSGIARNMSLRWLRSTARRPAELRIEQHGAAQLAELVSDIDLELELERDELIELLDRALVLLPPAARELLVRRYVDESPPAEIAGWLGLSEGAVAMRLQRGRRALQRVLRTDLREAAAEFNLVDDTEGGAWHATRIWCFYCGRHRLLGRLERHADGVLFQLRCAAWCRGEGRYVSYSDGPALGALLGSVRSYKPALRRIMGWVDEYYRHGDAVKNTAACIGCGRDARVELTLPARVANGPDKYGLHVHCAYCAGPPPHENLYGLAICTPQARRFWQSHPRIRVRPPRELEAEGRAALAIVFEQVNGAAELGVLVDRETFRCLRIHQNRRS